MEVQGLTLAQTSVANTVFPFFEVNDLGLWVAGRAWGVGYTLQSAITPTILTPLLRQHCVTCLASESLRLLDFYTVEHDSKEVTTFCAVLVLTLSHVEEGENDFLILKTINFL